LLDRGVSGFLGALVPAAGAGAGHDAFPFLYVRASLRWVSSWS
jgi:hypothetical protein